MMKFEQYDADDFIGAALSPCDIHNMPSDAGVSSAAMRHVLSSPMIFRRTSSATSVSSYSSSGPTTPTEEVAPATITPDMLYLSHGGADEYSTIDLKSCHDTYSPDSLRSTPVSSPVKSEFFDTPCTNILMTPATESYFSPFYSPSPMTFHSATAASFALQKIASETPSPPATPPPMSRSVSTASTLSGFSFASPPSAEDMSPTSSQSSSSFSSPTSLTSALLKDRSISISSSADKPHKCEKCPKRFKRLEHLRRHCRTHTDERPFICDVDSCRRKFSRSDNLRAHRRTHMKRGGRNDYIEGLGDLGN